MIRHSSAPAHQREPREMGWVALVAFTVLIGLYMVMRYSTYWAESDSTTFTSAIRAFVADGRLVPRSNALYPNGFAFQAISAAIVALTGVEVATLQQLIYPLLAGVVVLPAWVMYREMLGSKRAASLATMLLLTQPEFLFVILRSSHEKFTRTFTFICLFLLVRSFALRDRPRLFAVYVCLFYLSAFALVTSNNLLAHSFLLAVALALTIGWTLEHWLKPAKRLHQGQLRRLLYVTLISLGFVYLFIFYLYPPARYNLFVLRDVWERVRAIFLFGAASDEIATATNAYAYISFGWLNIPTYLMVSIANWVLLLASFVIWIRQIINWCIWRTPPSTNGAWLLGLLYATFALQGGLAVISDASGALASNVQHRLFPSVSIVAAGLVGSALGQWRPARYARLIHLGLGMALGCIVILSVMKATNEPLASNKWTFYRPAELDALRWADTRLAHSEIWSEFDERLAASYINEQAVLHNGNVLRSRVPREVNRVRVVSDVTRLRSRRFGIPLPLPPDAQQVYDNGEAQVYRLRPETPFQR